MSEKETQEIQKKENEKSEDKEKENKTNKNNQAICKVIFLGAPGVGKTSIITRFMYDQFTKRYDTTIGIDYFTKDLKVNDRNITLQIWDTAGQEQFQSLIPAYIRTSAMVIIVYDLSDPRSLDSAISWYEKIVDLRGNDFKSILAGNKSDLNKDVNESVLEEFLKQNPMPHMEISAKSGENISELFIKVAKDVSTSDLVKREAITIQAQPVAHEETENKSGCSC